MGANPDDTFGDEGLPAYTIGRAAEMLGTSQDFPRRLDEAKLIDRTARPAGTAATFDTSCAWPLAREMVDRGTALEAACRIIILEDQLEEALRQNEKRQRRTQRHV